jgi:hypothetical protein
LETTRRKIIKGVGGLGLYSMFAKVVPVFAITFDQQRVTFGGSGFNVPFSDISNKLGLLEASIEANNREGRRIWSDRLYTSLTDNFPGRVEGNPVELISERGDPGLLFSVGFDYENFVQILVPESHLDAAAVDAGLDQNDISYYYLFSSIRIYSLRLPRDGGGQITLIYSKPIKAASEELLPRESEGARREFVLDTLSGMRPGSTLGKFGRLATQISAQEAPFEPRHLKVRVLKFSDQAQGTFNELNLDRVFNANLFASVTGVAVNEAFDASVIPYVVTDFLARDLSQRFVVGVDMAGIFTNMNDSELASVFIDMNVSKVLRKISGENAAKQQIARGIAVDIRLTDNLSQRVVLETKLVRVEKREQVKGATEESWYRANDSIAMYELLETMMSSFFAGLAQSDRTMLVEAGIRSKDLTDDQIEMARSLLNECRYGA